MAFGSIINKTPMLSESNLDKMNEIVSKETDPSGYSGGKLNTAQEDIAAGAIGAGAGAIATGIGAGFEAGATRRAQNEARTMYEQERASNIKQQNVSNGLKRRALSNEERSMRLAQKQQEFDLRINRFINKIQQAMENQQYVLENKDKMMSALSNENVRSAILKSFV